MKHLSSLTKLTAVALLASMSVASAAAADRNKANVPLAEKVRHELVMLPWLGVFDDLRFELDGDTVTLSGQVYRPTLKSDAERVVRNIAGVERVKNNIEVLPLSPYDDRVRIAVARAVFGPNALYRYALGAQPSVRIIVKNGNVRLTGVVANEFDRNLAYIRAMGVAGAFTVTNDLAVASRT